MKPKQLRASFKHLSSLDNHDKIYLVGISFTKKSQLLLLVLFSFNQTVRKSLTSFMPNPHFWHRQFNNMFRFQWTNLFSDNFIFTTYYLFWFFGSLHLIMSLSHCTIRPWNIQLKQLDGKTSTDMKHKQTYTKLSLHPGTCPFNDIYTTW
jgi:hypothetical protein